MKKLLFLLIFLQTFSFATAFSRQEKWIKFADIPKVKKYLKPGDIIIFDVADPNVFNHSFGHISVLDENLDSVDFANFGYNFRVMSLEDLSKFEGERNLLVLRYKYMTDDFQRRLMDNIKKEVNKKYGVFAPIGLETNQLYCSLFVRNIYENANETDTNIFPLNKNYILPADFFDSGENFYFLDFANVL